MDNQRPPALDGAQGLSNDDQILMHVESNSSRDSTLVYQESFQDVKLEKNNVGDADVSRDPSSKPQQQQQQQMYQDRSGGGVSFDEKQLQRLPPSDHQNLNLEHALSGRSDDNSHRSSFGSWQRRLSIKSLERPFLHHVRIYLHIAVWIFSVATVALSVLSYKYVNWPGECPDFDI
jgi:hypothetical protein